MIAPLAILPVPIKLESTYARYILDMRLSKYRFANFARTFYILISDDSTISSKTSNSIN